MKLRYKLLLLDNKVNTYFIDIFIWINCYIEKFIDEPNGNKTIYCVDL